jgi:hypothetical protein
MSQDTGMAMNPRRVPGLPSTTTTLTGPAGPGWTAPPGDALIGRTLYLPEACAADEEHRELADVLEEVMFAAKPQLAGALLDRAHRLGIRAAFVAGDEVARRP